MKANRSYCRRVDLRSSHLYWPLTAPIPKLGSRPGRRLDVDVLIVGAGITGALAAHELTKAGATVAIADSRRAGSGSTPASTALLQYEIDTPLVKLSTLLGKQHAEAAYQASFRALADLKALDRELGRCIELVPRRSLHLAVKQADLRTFRAEAAARSRISIPARVLSRTDLHAQFGLSRPGAILSEHAIEVNPLKLTYQLLRAAKARGAVVLPRTRLDLGSLVERSRPFRISLRSGTRLIAKYIVIATGYETPEEFHEIAQLIELRSTFALATTPVRTAPWPEAALLWDAGDPYFYARAVADGRVLIGGEDEPFTTAAARDKMIGSKSQVLMKTLRTLLPHLRCTAAFRWAGTFAQTKDGLPYIGQHRKWPGVYFALGYGGNGITFSLIAAQIISASICGKSHRSERLFRFDR